jgi:site-specific DNA-cytosine methylase
VRVLSFFSGVGGIDLGNSAVPASAAQAFEIVRGDVKVSGSCGREKEGDS